MADSGRGREPDRRDDRDRRDARNSQEGRGSQYPPPPGEEDNRLYPMAQPMPQNGVSLPPIQQAGYYGPAPSTRHDPRSRSDYSGSPNGTGPPPYSSNYTAGPSTGYPPPYQPAPPSAYPAPPQPGGSYQLPPVTTAQAPRYASDGRPEYYQHPPQHGDAAYPPAYGGQLTGYVYAQQPQPQTAPRQRTAIACRYCRKRKIRCSGYDHTPEGKCTNCIKSHHDCVFQPVSSSSGAAFVSVQSLGGNIPAGTQVYGAFGQPLAREAGPGAGPAPASNPGGYGQMAPNGGHTPFYPPPPTSDYGMTSPTNSSFQVEERSSGAGANRRETEGHSSRLPPPNTYPGPDARRRSPASYGSTNSPSSSHEAEGAQRGSPTGSASGSRTGNATMSLSHMLDGNQQRPAPPQDVNRDIDHDMLGRLNQRRR